MTKSNIRVLVVDDSPLMRAMIEDCIDEAPGMEVVGMAEDGQHAVELSEKIQPDVITLDVEMPKMNGLEALDLIFAQKPIAVIVVSALTSFGANITLEALERGAIDFIPKPSTELGSIESWQNELTQKIKSASKTDLQKISERRERHQGSNYKSTQIQEPVKSIPANNYGDKVIVIGISTGGPPALTSLFENLRGSLPPIVIVQHMPKSFTTPFAARLNSITDLEVKEATTGDKLESNYVYIAPGGQHLYIRPHKDGRTGRLIVKGGELVSGHIPSADLTFECAADVYGDRCLGVIMTGMGRDGATGCGYIRKKGGFVLGQNEKSSSVYGMNKAAFIEGHVDRQFDLDSASDTICEQIESLWDDQRNQVAR
ncbi:MAG: chemotaxis response regulator protein-glutamate methylesterase [Pirellulaceae bacterium]|nr:chemotaxis response regulator protein-glutamate methylesterase [Pirellulaceae bacterium]